MMSARFALVCFVGFASMLAANGATLEVDPVAKEGMEKLNSYLTDNLPAEEDPAKNFKFASQALNDGADLDAKAKQAIGAFVAVSSKACNYETVDGLKYIISSNVAPKYQGTRVEGMVKYNLGRLFRECAHFLELEYDRLSHSLDREKLNLIKAVSAEKNIVFRGRYNANYSIRSEYVRFIVKATDRAGYYIDSYLDRIYDDMVQLSRNDSPANVFYQTVKSESGKVETIKNVENIRNAFQKYLAEPCKYYNEHFSQVFDSIFTVLVRRVHSDKIAHLIGLPNRVLDGLYHYQRCKVVLSLNQSQIDDLKHMPYYKKM